jgi:hypothetical protein
MSNLSDEERALLQRVKEAEEDGGFDPTELEDDEEETFRSLCDAKLVEWIDDGNLLPEYEAREGSCHLTEAGHAALDDE